MVKNTLMMLVAGGAVLVVTSAAEAQFWGSASMPRDGACFYRDANYRGDYFCVERGRNISSLPGDVSDKISSIRLVGRAEVTVFVDNQFRGASQRFDEDVPSLAPVGLNDRISSVQVHESSRSGRGGRSFGARNPDDIVKRAYQDILERDPDPAGLRTYRSRIIDDGWTEQQVREALRTSDEYREKATMTYPKAQEIVRRAYQAVLKREPDAGSQGYVNHVFRDKWSQADVERELRKSPEYRNR